MSKWKEKQVNIVQAFQGRHYDGWFGLGSDSRLYKWSQEKGAWEKFWQEQDNPS